jgi:hypothetical protein
MRLEAGFAHEAVHGLRMILLTDSKRRCFQAFLAKNTLRGDRRGFRQPASLPFTAGDVYPACPGKTVVPYSRVLESLQRFQIALFFFLAWLVLANPACRADDLTTIGVTQLRAIHPNLNGAGIAVAQPEAQADQGENDWELYPGDDGQPLSFATWINTNGTASTFPNSLGAYSGHAGEVGHNLYGVGTGAAPGVPHVDNYEADFFINYLIQSNQPVADQVVNQSFTFGVLSIADQQAADSLYDNYIATYSNLFCSGAADGGQVCAPATCYNGLGVGCYGVGAASSIGPTVDNGRSKPDLTAPSTYTSFSTPYVSGAGAVLLQAAANGAGGTNLAAAGDLRTLRALLVNGAIKPGDWTHTPTAPLDTRYGSGVLNLFYSYLQLAAGQQPLSTAQTVLSGASHPPGTPANIIPSLLGWDFQTITSSPVQDTVNHYYFNNVGGSTGPNTLTATLEWNRGAGESSINQLALFLYNCVNGDLITNSSSTVDNLQHLYLASLPSGEYDLEVVKYGSPSQSVSFAETYALAYQFVPISPPEAVIATIGSEVVISWAASPTLFSLQQTSSLAAPISWTPVNAVGLLSNALVTVTLNPPASTVFFRLSR